MFVIKSDTARFRRARTEEVYDALPLVPARRGQVVGQPSENLWWTAPREFGANYATALATDVVKTTARWLIVTTSAADRLASLGPQRRTSVRLVPFDFGSGKRIAGESRDEFVALDVPSVEGEIDRLRTGRRETVFLHPESLPPLFRLSPIASEVHCSEAAAKLVGELRGVSLAPAMSTPVSSGCTDAMLGVRRGDVSAIDAADLTARDAHGFALLHHAADVGDDEAVARVLEAGAPLDELTNLGVSALGVAAYRGHRAVVEGLLRRGADRSAGKRTAAQWAALAGHADLCLQLLDAEDRAPPPSALELALQEGHEDLAVRLADDPSWSQATLRRALDAAFTRRRHVAALAILRRIPFPSDPAEQAKLLRAAAFARCPAAVDLAIAQGADVNSTNTFGSTPLNEVTELAIRTNHASGMSEALAMVAQLVRLGADPSRRPTKGLIRSASEAAAAGLADAHADPYVTPQEVENLERLAEALSAR